MAYIGKVPANAPLTSSDIADGIISTADLANTAVTGAKVNTDVISAQTALATAPADTDEFLVSDAGVIKRIDYSLIKGGGAYEKISNTTVSSAVAQVDFNSMDTSTYTDFMVLYSGLQPVNDGVDLRLRLYSITDGAFYDSTAYRYGNISRRQGASTETNQSTSAGFILVGTNSSGNNATHSRNGKVEVFNMPSTSQWKVTRHHFAGVDSDEEALGGTGGGVMQYALATNGLRFYFSSGNIAAGSFTLYGRII